MSDREKAIELLRKDVVVRQDTINEVLAEKCHAEGESKRLRQEMEKIAHDTPADAPARCEEGTYDDYWENGYDRAIWECAKIARAALAGEDPKVAVAGDMLLTSIDIVAAAVAILLAFGAGMLHHW